MITSPELGYQGSALQGPQQGPDPPSSLTTLTQRLTLRAISLPCREGWGRCITTQVSGPDSPSSDPSDPGLQDPSSPTHTQGSNPSSLLPQNQEVQTQPSSLKP